MRIRTVALVSVSAASAVIVGLWVMGEPQPSADQATDAAAAAPGASLLLELARAEVATLYCHGVMLSADAVERLIADHGLQISTQGAPDQVMYHAAVEAMGDSAVSGGDAWCEHAIEVLAHRTDQRPAILLRAS